MLFRVMVLLTLSAVALALAACAETGSALAASVAEEAATIAATRAAMATTQAIDDLETASTQTSAPTLVGGQVRNIPHLPAVNKGSIVIVTHDLIIIQKDGKRIVVPRQRYDDDVPY